MPNQPASPLVSPPQQQRNEIMNIAATFVNEYFNKFVFLFNGRLARIPKPDRQGHLSLALALQVFYMIPETTRQGRLIYSAQNRRGEMAMRCCTHGDHRRLGM